MQVFVSYTWSKNRSKSRKPGAVDKFTKQLEQALEHSFPGVKVFQDIRDLPKGGPLENRLQKALNDSDVLLVLFSPAWLRSEWCRWEFTKFKKAKQGESLRIVPVLWSENTTLESTSENEIARELAAIDLVDVHGTLCDEKWSNPLSISAIAELAKQVVKSFSEEERTMDDARNYQYVKPSLA